MNLIAQEFLPSLIKMKKRHLVISGILFTAVIVLWPLFIIIAQPANSDENQFEWILNNLTLHRIQFFLAFLISPAIIYLMLSQLGFTGKQIRFQDIIGYIFLGGYLVLNSISYASQIILLPTYLQGNSQELAEAWNFGNPNSIAYFMNQLGYFFWAVSAILLFVRFLFERGIWRWITILYIASALLTFIAFAGLLTDQPILNFFTLISGLLLLPMGIISIIKGKGQRA